MRLQNRYSGIVVRILPDGNLKTAGILAEMRPKAGTSKRDRGEIQSLLYSNDLTNQVMVCFG